MTVTIESFSTKNLTAQPFRYEGDARTGRTSKTITVQGLLAPSEWLALRNVYDQWRDQRITDEDTLSSESIGTTVSVSLSANGVEWTNKECWFTEPPSGSQNGLYIEASATLVDATEALAVLLKNEKEVDCARIKADIEKRRDETACEIVALSTDGLGQDIAEQDIALELLNLQNQLAARQPKAEDFASLAYQTEIQSKTAQLGAASDYINDVSGVDKDLELLQKISELNSNNEAAASQVTDVYEGTETLRSNIAIDLEYLLEISQKEARLTIGLNPIAEIAELDAQLELLQSTANLDATTLARKQSIAGNTYEMEIINTQAEINALDEKFDELKEVRELKSLYDKAISESLVDLGFFTDGSLNIKLLSVADTYFQVPSLSTTAGGGIIVSGITELVDAYNVNAILANGTDSIDDVKTWYEQAVSRSSGIIPTSPPQFTAESILENGEKKTRVVVQFTAVDVPGATE